MEQAMLDVLQGDPKEMWTQYSVYEGHVNHKLESWTWSKIDSYEARNKKFCENSAELRRKHQK